tara:strand:+ start:84 stop:872 length:789 start_codon:yes stop_codon:yes gene_type:complete
MTNELLIKNDDGILDIVFNRPNSRNAITREMFDIFLNKLQDCKKESNIRAIFLSGTGDAFSAGGDVKDMAAKNDNSPLNEKTNSLRRIMEITKLLYDLPIPTVAIVKGPAAGAAFALALACDMRIATKEAVFTTAFSKIGFSGDFGGSYFLTKLVGTAKAKELYYFSEKIDAEKANNLGIINEIHEAADIDEVVKKLKNKFKELPPIAIKYMKKNLNLAVSGDLDLLLDQEALHMMICSETEDHKNAAKAFVKKEKPVFFGK